MLENLSSTKNLLQNLKVIIKFQVILMLEKLKKVRVFLFIDLVQKKLMKLEL